MTQEIVPAGLDTLFRNVTLKPAWKRVKWVRLEASEPVWTLSIRWHVGMYDQAFMWAVWEGWAHWPAYLRACWLYWWAVLVGTALCCALPHSVIGWHLQELFPSQQHPAAI